MTGKENDQQTEQTTRSIKPRAAMPMYERHVSSEVPSKIAFVVLSSGKVVEQAFSHELTLGRTISAPSPPTHVDMTEHMSKDAGVSRIHARLSVVNDSVCVEDLGSTNGTLLNGFIVEPFTQVGVKDGDMLELGKFKIKLQFKHADTR